MRSVRLGGTLDDSVASFEASMRVFSCGIRPGLRQVALLRAAVDGTMNSVRQDNAQRRLVEINYACAVNGDVTRATGVAGIVGTDPSIPAFLRPDPFYYDRGALFVRVLQVFAPDLKLGRAQTADPGVLQRLGEREAPRARLRLPQDWLYLRAAICFVRFQPELATRLVFSRAPIVSLQAIEAAIVNRSRDSCVGTRAKVYFDPVQFRFYLADALYRWAVAAAGVETLIPDDGRPRPWRPATQAQAAPTAP